MFRFHQQIEIRNMDGWIKMAYRENKNNEVLCPKFDTANTLALLV